MKVEGMVHFLFCIQFLFIVAPPSFSLVFFTITSWQMHHHSAGSEVSGNYHRSHTLHCMILPISHTKLSGIPQQNPEPWCVPPSFNRLTYMMRLVLQNGRRIGSKFEFASTVCPRELKKLYYLGWNTARLMSITILNTHSRVKRSMIFLCIDFPRRLYSS